MKSILKTFIAKAIVDYKNTLLDVIRDIIIQISAPRNVTTYNRRFLERPGKLKARKFTDPSSGAKYSFLLSDTPIWILYLLPLDESASMIVKVLYYINQALPLVYSLEKRMLVLILLVSFCVNMYFVMGLSPSSSSMLDNLFGGGGSVQHPEHVYELIYNSSQSTIPMTLDLSLNKTKTFIFQATQMDASAFEMATHW